jgi:hypothetical protein
MKPSFDADERTGTDLALFAVGFAGFILGAAGIVLRSVGLASAALVLLVVVSLGFLVRPSPGE